MATLELYNAENNWSAILDQSITAGDLSLVLRASGATGAPDVPFKFDQDNEIMICTLVQVDTPSAGLDTLTITRAADDTSASAHNAGGIVAQNVYASFFNGLTVPMSAVKILLYDMLGAQQGIQRTNRSAFPGNDFQVLEQAVPDMTVRVMRGSGLVSAEIIGTTVTQNSVTIVAPSGATRLDIIQIDQLSAISVKSGAEGGGAPSVDTDNMLLGTLTVETGTTTLTNATEIADSRTEWL